MNVWGILLATLAGILLLVALLWVIGKFFLPDFRQQWSQLAEELGLENRNPQGIYFDLRGRIEGVDVALDVLHQDYLTMVSRPSALSTSSRPWSRIRALLADKPNFQIRSRHQKSREAMLFPPRKSGDPAFDARYELFAPQDADLDFILPATVRQALLAADPPVHIIKNMVLWIERGFHKKPARLKQALHSCVQVARAVNGVQVAGRR